MADILDLVDVQELRNEVQKKYRDVAEKPEATYHFHTGRQHAIGSATTGPSSISCPTKAAKPLRVWPTRSIGRRPARGSALLTSVRAAEWIPSSPPYASGKMVGSAVST